MFEWIGKVIAGAVILLFGILLGGIVVRDLWSWFFVTSFGLPELSIASAIGISLMVGWLTKNIEETKKEEFWESLLKNITMVLFIWGTGWIIYQFV